ncbi:MAG: hypothetical protein ACI4C7_08235 [Clostridia bacterium]
MLVVKGGIYRNVTEQEAKKLIEQGYSPVSEKPIQNRGAKNGGAKS